MSPWKQGPVERATTETEALFQAATFANRLCGVCRADDPDGTEQRLTGIVTQFARVIDLGNTRCAELLRGATEKFRSLAPVLGLPMPRGRFVDQTLAWIELRAKDATEGDDQVKAA